jgi:hypothetical protein
VRKIGDNFNNKAAAYSSRAALLKNFQKWWGTIDQVFARRSDLVKFGEKLLKEGRSYGPAKASARTMIGILQTKDVNNKLRFNARQCYDHMGAVAVGSICSICDYDALFRYNDFKKTLYLNETDVKEFQSNCMRHIGESHPILAKLLKAVFELSMLKDDFSAPRDDVLFSQSSFFLNLQVGKIESHLKCNTERHNHDNSLACANFLQGYYSQGVLLKPEFALLPYMTYIKKWLYDLTMAKKRAALFQNIGQKDPKRVPIVAKIPALNNRVLIGGLKVTDKKSADPRPTQIIPGDGIDQLWEKAWEIDYIDN